MKITLLADAIRGFAFQCSLENLSKTTISNYVIQLSKFLDFAGNIALPSISVDLVRRYIDNLQNHPVKYQNHRFHQPIHAPLSPVSVRSAITVLSVFLAWANTEDLLESNPMLKVKKPKIPKHTRDHFNQAELERILQTISADTSLLGSRNRAIVLFLLDTGVRAAELCGLTLDRLDIEHGRAFIIGKGMKSRDVLFGKSTRKALWNYVTLHRPNALCSNVFLTRSNGPLTPLRLDKIIAKIGAQANVLHCYPHRFRHTAAWLLSRNGCNAFALQRILGHADMSTTRRYVELERDDVASIYERASPVDNLK